MFSLTGYSVYKKAKQRMMPRFLAQAKKEGSSHSLIQKDCGSRSGGEGASPDQFRSHLRTLEWKCQRVDWTHNSGDQGEPRGREMHCKSLG